MGVEIEIEGGPPATAPSPPVEEAVTVGSARFMDDDSGFVYLATDPSFFGTLFPAKVIVVDKSNFLGVPSTLNLANANDRPVGIVSAPDGNVYVVCQDITTDQIIVNRVAKNLSAQSRFDAGALNTFPLDDPFLDASFVVFGYQPGLGPNFGVCRFDIGTNAFTFSNLETENFVTTSVRNDTLNNEYFSFCSTSGGCTPASMNIDRGTFTFTARGGPGVCTNPLNLIPFRWTPFGATDTDPFGLLDSTSQQAFTEILPTRLLARIADRSSHSASAFTNIAMPIAGNTNNSECWRQESVTAPTSFFIVSNQAPATVAKIQKNPLALTGVHLLSAGRNNGNALRIDDAAFTNQFFYVLTLAVGQQLVRFSKSFLIP